MMNLAPATNASGDNGTVLDFPENTTEPFDFHDNSTDIPDIPDDFIEIPDDPDLFDYETEPPYLPDSPDVAEVDNFMGLDKDFFDGLFVCIVGCVVVYILYNLWSRLNPSLEEQWERRMESEWEVLQKRRKI